MKKFLLAYVNIIIFLTLLAGFLTITIISYSVYSDVIKKDLEAISELASSNIYSDINGEITKPVFVSLTMANDIFLKNWFSNEEKEKDNPEHRQGLVDYLVAYKRVYGYDSFSVISDTSGIYYHFDGVHKKISRDDPHDVWYFNFIDKNIKYTVNIDNDEVNQEILTVFIDSRIENEQGKLLGVVGVGVKMTKLQSILEGYFDKYGVESFITDKLGLVKIHTNDELIDRKNLSELYDFDVTNFGDSAKWYDSEWYQLGGNGTHVTVKYISVIDSYLVVRKDAKSLAYPLRVQILLSLFLICLISGVLTFSTTYIVNHYRRFMINLSGTDELTSLRNRRAFVDIMDAIIKKHGHEGQTCLFMFDIDNFKAINDDYGHPFGDLVLKSIGDACVSVLGSNRNVFRTGGDEFCGIVHGDEGFVNSTLESLLKKISEIPEAEKCPISVSIGATWIDHTDTLNSIMERADKALYESKNKGRNTITYVNFKKGEK